MIATAVLAADIAGTLDLADTSEVRVRSTPALGFAGATAPPNTPPAHGLDVITRPEAHLHLGDRRWDYAISYSASFLAPDLEAGFTPQLLQLGSVRVGWRDRGVAIGVQQDGTYGVENSAYLIPTLQPTPGQPTPPQALAQASTITFAYSRSLVDTEVKFDRRTLGKATVEYLVSGGLDATSQLVLPQMHGPRATVLVDHAASRTDHLLTTALAQEGDFSPAPCLNTIDAPGTTCQNTDRLAQITEALRHTLSRTESFSGTVGAAAAAVRFHPYTPFQTSYFPVVETTYTRTFARGGTLTLFARVAPYVDLLTAAVLNTAQGEVRLLYPVSPLLALHLDATVSQSLPVTDPAALTGARGDVSIDFHVSRHVDVGFGERWFWQESHATAGSATMLASAYGFLAVTVHDRTLRF
jgi:hypothetical protein